MKVIALISGGKDSTFNMMECVKNGHEVVALVNLRPPESLSALNQQHKQSNANGGDSQKDQDDEKENQNENEVGAAHELDSYM